MIPGYDARMNLDEIQHLGRRVRTIRDRFDEGSTGWVRWNGHLQRIRTRFVYLQRVKEAQ